jgi:hypothetical protein
MKKYWLAIGAIVLLAVGFVFYRILEHPSALPSKTVDTIRMSDQGPPATDHPKVADASAKEVITPERRAAIRERMQSTYVPQAASSQPTAPTAPSANDQSDRQTTPKKSAAEIISALESDDHKSAFPNPSIAPHQVLLNETPDPDWSQAAAQQLRDYLAAELGNRFEYPLVQCGQDICEIQAATLPGSNRGVDVHDFQVSDENMHLQPWWSTLQFDELTFQVDSADDGIDVMIVFITRK